jgi:simple sugar transport system substrate-binding protein
MGRLFLHKIITLIFLEEIMKKLLAILLVLSVVAASVFAGGGRQQETKARDVITVGFAQAKSDESDWRMANTRSMLSSFNRPGYRLILSDSNNDAARQVADVQGFIDQDFDYIVIAAVNMDGWDTVLRNAQRAGIPVILVDRNINVSDPNLFKAYIGPDFKVEGEMAVGGIERHFGSRPVNIVNLQGQLGSGAQVGRSSALDDAVAARSGWNLLARQTGNWGTDTAKQITTSWIQQFRDTSNPLGVRFNVVYAENDNMADGAI